MAQPKTMNGTQLVIKLGDGAGSEVFTAKCTINAARGITFSSQSNEQIVPDCDNPDLPAWVERNRDGLSASITGAGVVDTSNLADFWAWYTQQESRNIQVLINVSSGDGGGYWGMAAILSEFSVNGERKQKALFDCTILSDGPVTWTSA